VKTGIRGVLDKTRALHEAHLLIIACLMHTTTAAEAAMVRGIWCALRHNQVI
jgi:hypothetical protein